MIKCKKISQGTSGSEVQRLLFAIKIILIAVLFSSVQVNAQTVTGTISDASTGQPLPGVNISIEGTTIGTISDIQGQYSITVPGPETSLRFSFIGYVSQTVIVSNRTTIDVEMALEQTELSEVIVVGYGTQKRGDITGSVAVMDADQLDERPLTRIDQALVGQMAGVRIKQTSGVPGEAFSIQVRGSGSITANTEPLYVIDGFPLEVSSQNTSGNYAAGNPLDNLNPNDIESIQVLKDASAGAIYGARGSNGVVLITTKKGQSGKARISFNVYTGWNEAQRQCEVLSGEQWVERATEMINYNYLRNDPGTQNRQVTDDYDTRLSNIGSFNSSQILDPRWAMPGHPGLIYYNYQDEAFRRGPVTDYQLSATGGNEYVNYYISGDVLDETGYLIGTDYRRFAFRSNIEAKASEKLTFGLNLAPSYSIQNDPGAEGKDNQMHLIAGFTPVSEDTVGLYMNTGDYPRYTWGGSRNSPIMVMKHTTGRATIFRTLATAYAAYDLIEGLTFKTTFNLDNAQQQRKFYRPAWVSGNPGARQASGSYSGYNRLTFVNENTLSYNATFGENTISAVAGISYSNNTFSNFRISSTGGFTTDYITTLNDAVGINGSSTDTRESRNVLLSYFGRVQYDYQSKYLFTATLRRDGSSRFGNDTKWGIFPSVSAGWRISEESFMDNVSAINNLKIRASWGISGNEAMGGDYESIALLESANYVFNNTFVAGQAPSNFPNSDLGWESSESINLGVDFGIMQNRLFGSFEYYNKVNSDLLLEIPVPSATGFTTALTNIGKVENRGWDLELGGRILTGSLNWTANLTLSHNRNEVLQLGPDNAPILGGAFDINHNILTVGEPMYSIYVVKQDGILSQADIDAGAALYGTQTEGDPKYVDYLEDGVIDADDRQILGHPDPNYIWGVTNSFHFKGFDLTMLVQGQRGGTLYSIFGRAVNRTGTGIADNVLATWDKRWRSPSDPGDGLVGKTTGSFGRIKNTDWMYPNDYWRIRNITLGYDMGRIINTKIFSGFRLYATAENWFGQDKYVGGFNPESVNTEGEDYGAAPLTKSIIFGVNLSF